MSQPSQHVAVVTPTGAEWDCPKPFLPIALKKGYRLAGEEPDPDEPDGQDGDQPFDPTPATPKAVNEYLQGAFAAGDGTEIDRVLVIEAEGKNRTSIVDPRPAVGAGD